MKSYQQRMETSGIADRLALLAHDHLVPMYEGLGFEGRGKSDVRFAGGGWNNLVSCDFFLFFFFPLSPWNLATDFSPRHMSLPNLSGDLENLSQLCFESVLSSRLFVYMCRFVGYLKTVSSANTGFDYIGPRPEAHLCFPH